MKKLFALLLVFAMVLPMCGCGKSKAVANVEGLISAIGEVTLDSGEAIASAQKAFDALSSDEKSDVENYYILVDSQAAFQEMEEERLLDEAKKAQVAQGKEAYANIKFAWQIVEQAGSGIYGVWHGWVWDKEDVSRGIPFFVDETNLSETDIVEGLAARNYTLINAGNNISWLELDSKNKQDYRTYTIQVFEKASKSKQYCDMNDALWGTVYAYQLNGMMDDAQKSLEEAKLLMKGLPEDYEHYPVLKAFYTTTSALYDFCVSPSGSLTQYAELLNEYRKEASDYMNDLDFIFE